MADGLRPQLLIGTDLPLATAAHNAARFPFINPIGSLHTDPAVGAPGGHLADGGYFDNSGAQSTLDVVDALAACLSEQGDRERLAYPECHALGAERRLWLRQHLVPQILMIRNEAKLENSGEHYAPEQAREPPANRLFSDALGPALALFHVSGIGANRRLAEARQADAVQVLRERWQSAVGTPPARSLDLLPDGTLYPLGWHLSRAAIEGMRCQAAHLQAP